MKTSHVSPLLMLAACTLIGCAHPILKMQPLVPPAEQPLRDGNASEMSNPSYFDSASLNRKFAHEVVANTDFRSQGNQPGSEPREHEGPFPVGIALSGGGSKAAAYSMGLLHALWDEKILKDDIDIISTVSGGGYAAYWFYSRLADFYLESQRAPGAIPARDELKIGATEEVQNTTDDFFCECLPYRYSGLMTPALASTSSGCGSVCPSGDQRWLSPDGTDRWRYQNHLRGYTDVFSNNFEMGAKSEALGWDIAQELGRTLITLPGYFVTNLLFDWKTEVSPTQKQYRLGIERTYGLKPVDMAEDPASGCSPDVIADARDGCKAGRPVPNRLVGRGVTFATLYLARKEQQAEFERQRNEGKPDNLAYGLRPRVPMFVVNTTAGVAGSPFDLLEDSLPDFEDSVFEFTPAGYGSRLYGYWPGSHPDIDVAKSVSASGAFFDSQQRNVSWPKRVAVALLLRSFQLEWGVDIANPSQPDRVRAQHAFLPFPFYILHRKTKNSRAPHIHLADGGQSDNTGIFSLVRRGTRVIIYADAGEDREGRFSDLCVLRKQLKRKQLHLYVPTLSHETRNFANECDAVKSGDRGKTKPYPLWSFSSGVLEGCITRNADDVNCDAPADSGYRARLFILKPSMNLNEGLRTAVESCISSGKHAVSYRDFMDRLDTDQCRDGAAAASSDQPGMPPELFGYLVRNWSERSKGQLLFPQHKTWKITLNSSSTMFGAYKSLGQWHMRQLLEHQPLLRTIGSYENLQTVLGTAPRRHTYLHATLDEPPNETAADTSVRTPVSLR